MRSLHKKIWGRGWWKINIGRGVQIFQFCPLQDLKLNSPPPSSSWSEFTAGPLIFLCLLGGSNNQEVSTSSRRKHLCPFNDRNIKSFTIIFGCNWRWISASTLRKKREPKWLKNWGNKRQCIVYINPWNLHSQCRESCSKYYDDIKTLSNFHCDKWCYESI